MLPVDAGLDADLERHELERSGLRLADPHLGLRLRRLIEDNREGEGGDDDACSGS